MSVAFDHKNPPWPIPGTHVKTLFFNTFDSAKTSVGSASSSYSPPNSQILFSISSIGYLGGAVYL